MSTTKQPLTVEQRILRALSRTNQVIGSDLGWDQVEPSRAEVREVVADSLHLEQFGGDAEAVAAYRKMPQPVRKALLIKAFP